MPDHITQVWPIHKGPYCGNMMLMSGCMIDCGRRFGGCIVPPEERKAESEVRRATFQPSGQSPDTLRNARVQDRYDQLMHEGKHGHYETMFQVVREEIQKATSGKD